MKQKENTEMLHIRVNKEEKEFITAQASRFNFRSVSEYIRFLSLNEWDIEIKEKN